MALVLAQPRQKKRKKRALTMPKGGILGMSPDQVQLTDREAYLIGYILAGSHVESVFELAIMKNKLEKIAYGIWAYKNKVSDFS